MYILYILYIVCITVFVTSLPLNKHSLLLYSCALHSFLRHATQIACKAEQTAARRLFAARMHLIRNQERRRASQWFAIFAHETICERRVRCALRLAVHVTGGVLYLWFYRK